MNKFYAIFLVVLVIVGTLYATTRIKDFEPDIIPMVVPKPMQTAKVHQALARHRVLVAMDTYMLSAGSDQLEAMRNFIDFFLSNDAPNAEKYALLQLVSTGNTELKPLKVNPNDRPLKDFVLSTRGMGTKTETITQPLNFVPIVDLRKNEN